MKLEEMLHDPEYIRIMKEKKKHFISHEAIDKIQEFLELNGKEIEDVQNIRNEIVLYFSDLPRDEMYNRMDEFMALTCVLDVALANMGVVI